MRGMEQAKDAVRSGSLRRQGRLAFGPFARAAKIRAFFVHPEWVRRGIGTRVLEACESAALAAGFKKFEMGAPLTGVALYKARGYREVEEIGVPVGNGELLPIVRMEKKYRK